MSSARLQPCKPLIIMFFDYYVLKDLGCTIIPTSSLDMKESGARERNMVSLNGLILSSEEALLKRCLSFPLGTFKLDCVMISAKLHFFLVINLS